MECCPELGALLVLSYKVPDRPKLPSYSEEYGKNIWQRHFYDHIIRDTRDYEEHIAYIYGNPARWYYDELYEE